MLFPRTPTQRSIVSDAIAPHIRFEDDGWAEADKRILRGAIMDFEVLDLSPTARDHPSRSWMCYSKRLSGMTAYMAHCGGWDYVLFAYSAAEA